ncbi:hypothetical protein [Leptospira noguchii]|uniref:Uncharacterized protein n=1 Tax=Leptospira noguchii TaxID=28182 RepID=A0AAE9GDK2_9LEPT|nr:hypothetical protein [Leptospira noguchii]UOG55947.1 hypothetical protein MAL03_13925 [Leptospira noguchii]
METKAQWLSMNRVGKLKHNALYESRGKLKHNALYESRGKTKAQRSL